MLESDEDISRYHALRLPPIRRAIVRIICHAVRHANDGCIHSLLVLSRVSELDVMPDRAAAIEIALTIDAIQVRLRFW
jgi:hypothetical protein